MRKQSCRFALFCVGLGLILSCLFGDLFLRGFLGLFLICISLMISDC